MEEQVLVSFINFKSSHVLMKSEHACAVASSLGIKRIVVHKYSSILSAYGIGLAEIESDAVETCSMAFSMEILPQIQSRIRALEIRVKKDLTSQDVNESSIVYKASLTLHYQGTETNISISTPEDWTMEECLPKPIFASLRSPSRRRY